MEKFRVEVTRTDTYQGEIDPTVWTDERIKGWANYFYKTEDRKELAEHLASSMARNGSTSQHEGFGIVVLKDRKDKDINSYEENRNDSIIAKIISEDCDIECSTKQLKP